MREARPHIEFFFNKLLRMPPEMLLPPGYLSLASMQGVMQAKRALSTGNQTIEDMMEKGVFLCGSPATLREKLEKYQAEIGFGYLLPAIQFGTLPHELVRKSVELFAKRSRSRTFRARRCQFGTLPHELVRKSVELFADRSDPAFPGARAAPRRRRYGLAPAAPRTRCAAPGAARRAQAPRAPAPARSSGRSAACLRCPTTRRASCR